MAVLVTAATIAETNDTSNVTTYASGSFTPVANRLYLLAVSHSDTAPEATVPTIATTTGLNFVQVGSSIAYDTIASNVHRLTLFRAMKSSGLSAGTYTVTLADAATGAASVLIEVTQVDTTGTDGANAVRNVSTNVADTGSNPSITMAGAFASGNNGVAAFFGFNSQTAATAPNGGWAVIGDASYATPATGVTALWTGANAGTASCTHGSANWAGIAVELVSEAVPDIRPPQPPDPPKAKAALSAAILAGACFFNPLAIPPPDVIDGTTGTQNAAARLAPVVVQYQGHAGPLYVPDVTKPVTALSWKATYPDRVSRLSLPASQRPAWTSDKFDPPTPSTVTIGWLPTYPESARGARQPVELGRTVIPAFVPDVTQPVTALSWTPEYPVVIQHHTARRAQQAPQAVWPIYVADVTVTAPPLSWKGLQPDRVPAGSRLRAAQQQVVAWHPSTPVTVVETIDGAIASGGGNPLTRVVVQYQGLAAPVVVPAPVQAPALVSAVYPASVPRVVGVAHLRGPQPEFGFVVDVPVQAWLPTYPSGVSRFVRLTERGGLVAPLYVADVTVVAPVRSWAPTYPDRALRAVVRASLHPAWFSDKFDPPNAVVVPDLSWRPSVPDLVVRRVPFQATGAVAPVFVPDVTQPVTALSWRAVCPDAASRATVPAVLRLAFAAPIDPPATVTQPVAVYPDRLTRPVRVQPVAWTGPLYLADVTVLAPVRSWAPIYPDRVIRLTVHASRIPAVWFESITELDFSVPVTGIALIAPERVGLQTPYRRGLTAPERAVWQAIWRRILTAPDRDGSTGPGRRG